MEWTSASVSALSWRRPSKAQPRKARRGSFRTEPKMPRVKPGRRCATSSGSSREGRTRRSRTLAPLRATSCTPTGRTRAPDLAPARAAYPWRTSDPLQLRVPFHALRAPPNGRAVVHPQDHPGQWAILSRMRPTGCSRLPPTASSSESCWVKHAETGAEDSGVTRHPPHLARTGDSRFSALNRAGWLFRIFRHPFTSAFAPTPTPPPGTFIEVQRIT